MYFRSGFTFSEATTTISIFLPITSVYTSAIIKDPRPAQGNARGGLGPAIAMHCAAGASPALRPTRRVRPGGDGRGSGAGVQEALIYSGVSSSPWLG
jgi:hypothetical protein